MPKKLYKTLKTPAAKKKDYLFSRYIVEQLLYNASADLCAAIRPIVEVLSVLTTLDFSSDKVLAKVMEKVMKKLNVSRLKNLLGHGILGICSANIKISRGRRELARRFVRIDWAEALYAVKPTHSSIFGGTSLEDAIKTAKESSKLDSSLVYAPRKKPFRPSFSYYKDFQYPPSYQGRGGKSQGFRQYQNQPYYPNKSRGKNQTPRGRGRGGKRGAKSARASNSQE